MLRETIKEMACPFCFNILWFKIYYTFCPHCGRYIVIDGQETDMLYIKDYEQTGKPLKTLTPKEG